jgi:serine/threonine protein kinase
MQSSGIRGMCPRCLFACTSARLVDEESSELPGEPGTQEMLLPGLSVGPDDRFLLLDKLGEGAMGEVWLASDQELSREDQPELVALKFLSQPIRQSGKAMDILRSEVRQSQRLSHPNIVRIFDLHLHRGMPFIKMEFVEANSLRHWLDERPDHVMPWRLTARLTQQLASALRYAHETEGVIHRDLKPANLMLSEGPMVKLSDFGIAAARGGDPDRAASGLLLGTLWYASPQQLAGGPPRPEDDIYSLGATLYELLTGSVPFEADTEQELLYKIRHETAQPVPLRLKALDRRNEVPPSLQALVKGCLEKDPLSRPQTREVIKLLTPLVDPWLPARGSPSRELTWEQEEPVLPRGSNRRALGWLAVLVALAVAWWLDVSKWRTRFEDLLTQHYVLPPWPAPPGREPPPPRRNPPPQPVNPPSATPAFGTAVVSIPHVDDDRAMFPIGCEFSTEDGQGRTNDWIRASQRSPKYALLPGNYRLVLSNNSRLAWVVELPLSISSNQQTQVEFAFKFADLTVATDPEDAECQWPRENSPGEAENVSTNRCTKRFKSGVIPFTVSRRGYMDLHTNYLFNPLTNSSANDEVLFVLQRRPVPQPHTAWTNSLNMVFQWIGPGLWACETETTVHEFREFAKATGHNAKEGMFSLTTNGWKQSGSSWDVPGFAQTEDCPVVGVNWDDANTFCRFLTARERQAGWLLPDQAYRLPSTNEWFRLAARHRYPWGEDGMKVEGNYAGTEVIGSNWPASWPVLSDHRDRYSRTAPVRSVEFRTNELGLYHLGGNAAEWCLEKVLCGGSWCDGEDQNLQSLETTAIRVTNPSERYDRNGFRAVIAETVSVPERKKGSR